ncbi:hypothetical protein GF342_03935 [Candidatus Woesearchaeota archaeon]|nr:hypothetical protein [Candidatus Woesearchaeota archaeon]
MKSSNILFEPYRRFGHTFTIALLLCFGIVFFTLAEGARFASYLGVIQDTVVSIIVQTVLLLGGMLFFIYFLGLLFAPTRRHKNSISETGVKLFFVISIYLVMYSLAFFIPTIAGTIFRWILLAFLLVFLPYILLRVTTGRFMDAFAYGTLFSGITKKYFLTWLQLIPLLGLYCGILAGLSALLLRIPVGQTMFIAVYAVGIFLCCVLISAGLLSAVALLRTAKHH